jgi:hypothetical protein
MAPSPNDPDQVIAHGACAKNRDLADALAAYAHAVSCSQTSDVGCFAVGTSAA